MAAYKRIYWTTANGVAILINNLTLGHIQSILYRYEAGLPMRGRPKSYWVPILTKEKLRRTTKLGAIIYRES